MLVYFKNWKSKIAAKRNSKTNKLAYAVGEFVPSEDTHTVCVTVVDHYGNQKSSGYGPGYHTLETWTDPTPGMGPYSIPGIAGTDEGILVAAWTKKESTSTVLRMCKQDLEVTSWSEGWSDPVTVHVAQDIAMVCCLPAHGSYGVDIYFRAKAISDGEWYLYRIWTDAQGNYEGSEVIDLEGFTTPPTEDDWTASVLGDGRKVILFRVEDPADSKAMGVLVKSPGGQWTGPFYLTTWIKMPGEQGYEWVLWDNVVFQDGYGIKTLWMRWNGGGSDKNNIIHVLKMAIKYKEGGTEFVEDIYFRIDIDQKEARGEFLFSEMGVPWDHVNWEYEEALGVEYLTGIPHVWFAGDGGAYSVVYYAKKFPGQTEWGSYSLYWDGTREELGCTRDDFGGSISMVGNQWEWRDDMLLRGSVSTMTCNISPDKGGIFRQSQSDTEANFYRSVKDSLDNEISESNISEAFSKVKTPSLSMVPFSDPFPLPKEAVNYTLYWSPSYEDSLYLLWICRATVPFKYLLPDIHPHSVYLDHDTLDGQPHVLIAEIHNQAHPYTEEETDVVPGAFVCRFYENNPDPDGNGIVSDPLPPGCEELGEVLVQGMQPGGVRDIRVNLDLEGDPRHIALYVAVDVSSQVNEKTIYDDLGDPQQSEENNVLGNNVFLMGVLHLHVGHDKMVYVETDTEVNLYGIVTDGFLKPVEGCILTGQIKIPFEAIYRDTIPNPWTDQTGGNYSAQYIFFENDPFGFYLYEVTAQKADYVTAQETGSFIYGKQITGTVTVMPTPDMDSVKKKDLITLVGKFAGTDGPLLVTGVSKSNFDAITFNLEEPEEKLGDVIESFSEGE